MNLEFSYFTLRGKYYPLIPIRLHYQDRNVRTYGLVDSGSTISVFRGEIAEDLGITIRKGKEQVLQSANGLIKVYTHTLTADVHDERFELSVGFSTELITSFNILGREGFFDHFRILFDESRSKIALEL